MYQTAPPSAASEQPSDQALARLAGLGDREAFAAIVTRYGPALYRFTFRIVDSPPNVEDALQETFLDAWKGIAGFRGDSSLQTWLFTLARRRAYAHYKRLRTSGSHPNVNIDDVTDRLPSRNADPPDCRSSTISSRHWTPLCGGCRHGSDPSGSSKKSRTSPTLRSQPSWPPPRTRSADYSNVPAPASRSP